WTDAETEVTYCVLSDGEAGGFDPAIPRSEIPQARRAEQAEGAALLGVHDVRFFGLGEGGFRQDSHELHVDLVRVIRQVRPQRVVTWSPEWNWQRFRSCHPDHLATGAAVLTAIYPDAGNPFALPQLKEQEGLDAWTVPEVWLINSPAREVNHYLDITETFDRKVAAVRAHASQIKDPDKLADRLRQRIPPFAGKPAAARAHTSQIKAPDPLADRPRQRIAPNTPAAGLPEGRLAEAFQVVVTG